jgi:hypothetical protein
LGGRKRRRDGGNDECMYNQNVSFEVHSFSFHDGKGFWWTQKNMATNKLNLTISRDLQEV